ncbi:MAG TPA: hypothetical protein VNL69_07210 [Bacteroidota bacterium]|nr:hypothetical protein [Bacteroidota bacterium]
MNTHGKQHPEEQDKGLSPQFKILIAIIVGGVLLLILQVIGVF